MWNLDIVHNKLLETKSRIMMRYYWSVNNKISGRKSAYFNVNNLKKDVPVYGTRREHKKDSSLDVAIKWITNILLLGVLSSLAYMCFVGFVSG